VVALVPVFIVPTNATATTVGVCSWLAASEARIRLQATLDAQQKLDRRMAASGQACGGARSRSSLAEPSVPPPTPTVRCAKSQRKDGFFVSLSPPRRTKNLSSPSQAGRTAIECDIAPAGCPPAAEIPPASSALQTTTPQASPPGDHDPRKGSGAPKKSAESPALANSLRVHSEEPATGARRRILLFLASVL